MTHPDTDLPFIVAIVASCAAAWTDHRTGVIPNALTLPLLLCAPLAHMMCGGPGAMASSLLSLAICGAVPLAMFLKGGMGGGDVKLFAALGAVMPLDHGLTVQLLSYTYVAGGAVASHLVCGHFKALLTSTWHVLRSRAHAGGQLDRAQPGGAATNEVRMGIGIMLAAITTAVAQWI